MLNIENAHPTAKGILEYIDKLEAFCLGDEPFTPAKFREINEVLSIGAVLMLGKHRYQKSSKGKKLVWKGLDNCEYDMGFIHDADVMRNYPGFNAKYTKALGGDLVHENKIISVPNRKGSLSVVIMKDGSKGIGPNYRIALRNAALKMHLKSKFNYFSLANIWKQILGHA